MADGVSQRKMVKLLEQAFLDAGTANTPPAELLKNITSYLTAEGSSGMEITSSLLESFQHYLEITCKSAPADSIILILSIQKIAENKELLLPLAEKCSSAFDNGSPSDAERIISTFSPESIPERELSIIEKIAETGVQNQVLLAHIYGRSGIMRTQFLDSIDWKMVGSTEAKSIIYEYAGLTNDPKALEVLKIISDHLGNETWLRILGLKLIGEAGAEDRIRFLDGFPFGDLKDVDDIIVVTDSLLLSGNWKSALDAVNNALNSRKSNDKLLRQKVKILLSSGEKVEAYEIIKEILKGSKDSLELARTALDIAYSQGLMDEFLELSKAYPAIFSDPSFLSRKIDAEIQKSMFGEALKDITEGLAANQGNLDLLNMKFRTLVKLTNTNDAYNTALEILKINPKSEEHATYIVDLLFKREEYDQVLSFMERYQQIRQSRMEFYISSLFYMDRQHEAIKALSSIPTYAENPLILDSVFFNVRLDENLKELESFIILHREETAALKIITDRLRGVPSDYSSIDGQFLDKYPSTALAFIKSWFYVSSGRKMPDDLLNALSKPIFRPAKATADLIQQATEGKIGEEIMDSAKYLFPISETYVRNGKLDRAERELIRAASNQKDPFYLYLMAMIDFQRGDYTSSRKNVDASLDKLLNCDFLILAVELAMIYGETKKIREHAEKLVSLGSLEMMDLGAFHSFASRNKFWEMASDFLSYIGSGTSHNPWIFRIRRDVLRNSGNLQSAIEQSLMLFRTRQFSRQDIDLHMAMLKDAGKPDEVLQFLGDLETENRTPEIEILLAGVLNSMGKYDQALNHCDAAIQMGVDPLTIPGYLNALIEVGQYEKAQDIMSKNENDLLQLKLYQKTSQIPQALALLKRVTFKRQEDQEILKAAVETLWYNRDVRDLIVKIYSDEGFVWLGKLIARKTFDSGDTKLALEVARNLNRNEPGDLDTVRLYSDILVRTGRRTDAIELILRSLRFCKEFANCLDIVNILLRLYYEDRDYDAIKKFYETNPKYVDDKSLQYVIRSYIETDDFDMAEKIMSRYEGTLLKKDIHGELMEDLRSRKEFVETLLYVSRLLKVEYKAKKKFDKKEAFYKADIPIEKIEDVFAFLDSREYYFDINEEKYELLSRDVIQKAVRNYPLDNINDMTIAVIFNNLDRRDPIIARNLYIYIHDQMDIARHAQTKNDVLLRLLKRAIKDNVRQEPLNVAFYLQIGISEALDVITLMEYISRMNEERGV